MKVPNVLDTINGGSVDSPAESTTKKPSRFAFRHFQCFIVFIGLSATYAMRVNLSVAIVAMTDKQDANPNFDEYNWNTSIKSYLLSSFFWGYIITQIPAGALARRYGGYITLLISVILSSILTILIPLCAKIGDYPLVLVLRVCIGLVQGFIFPSTHTLISSWSCTHERGLFTTYTYSGAQLGTFLMLGISGVLSTSSFGWPSIFYFSGVLGLFFSVLYFFFGSSGPSTSKWISPEEIKIIESSQNAEKGEDTTTTTSSRIPWFEIMTSPAFLVLILAQNAYNLGYWTLLTEIPTYTKYILGQDIKANALLSSLPYFAKFVMGFVIAFVSKILDKYNLFSREFSRKLFNSIGFWIPMISLIALNLVGESNVDLAIGLLTISVGFNASCYLGWQTNHIDLSPNYAGILMGITNCSGSIISIIAPLLVGFIVTDNRNKEQWRIVFYITSFVYLIGNLLFIIFGKADVQPWNEPDREKKTNSSRRPSLLAKDKQK